MADYTEIFNKLGGISPAEKEGDLSEEEKENYILSNSLKDSPELIEFISSYGGQSLNEFVNLSGLKDLPDFPSGEIPVSIFFGFIKGPFGVEEISGLTEENIPKGYVPFAMGDPTGDYWVYHVESKAVYFWKHDAPEEEDLFKAADSVSEFVSNLIIDKSSDDDNNDFIVGDFVDDYFD